MFGEGPRRQNEKKSVNKHDGEQSKKNEECAFSWKVRGIGIHLDREVPGWELGGKKDNRRENLIFSVQPKLPGLKGQTKKKSSGGEGSNANETTNPGPADRHRKKKVL